MKHVIVAQDLSCFGKCSLTIALPVLSTAQIATSVFPNALLSSHTGGLGKVHIKDLHEDMQAILRHWQSIPFSIDALYSGYVANIEQMEQIHALFSQYPHAFKLVDPVMGDHGKLYASLCRDLPSHMRILCEEADLITPNLTEAYALLGKPYTENQEEVEEIIKQLYTCTHAQIVLTGIPLENDQIGCALYCGDDTIIWHSQTRIPQDFHGSGDLFAAALLGAYLQSGDLHRAVDIAQTFVAASLQYSAHQACDERFGILFEPLLHAYHEMLWKK